MDFHTPLLQWYDIHKRELPWRNSKEPYIIWLSEIIMQQTRIEQGLPYFLNFTTSFSTIQELASAPIDKVLKLWQGLGYYSRARNLHQTAKIVSKEFNGIFPNNKMELQKLPGIGDYTASAIASICFNAKEPAIDGNLNRVTSRLFDIEEPVDKSSGRTKIHTELLLAMDNMTNYGDFNQALMDFGASICNPKTPECQTCFLQDLCMANLQNNVLSRPVKSIKVKSRSRYFTYIHILYKGNTYLRKRDAKDIWQGLYEFPLIETKNEPLLEELTMHSTLTNIITKGSDVKIERISMKPHILSHQKLYSSFLKINTNTKPCTTKYLTVQENELIDYAFPKLIEQYLNKT